MINVDYREIAQKNQSQAWDIIRTLNLEKIWNNIGVTANLVGSLRLGLLVKHLDIDFHLYSKTVSIFDDFSAMAILATQPGIQKIEYINLLETPEQCLEWHAWYIDQYGQNWQLDMIHLPVGSRFDGCFERQADRISSLLNDQNRDTILRLKYETPNDVKICGIEYYRAVLQGNVQTYRELIQWRLANPVTGIVEWLLE